MQEPVRCQHQSKREFTECTHVGNQECRNEFTKDVKVASIHGGIIIAFHHDLEFPSGLLRSVLVRCLISWGEVGYCELGPGAE